MTYFNAILTFENIAFREYILCCSLLMFKTIILEMITFIFSILRGSFVLEEDRKAFQKLLWFLPLKWIVNKSDDTSEKKPIVYSAIPENLVKTYIRTASGKELNIESTNIGKHVNNDDKKSHTKSRSRNKKQHDDKKDSTNSKRSQSLTNAATSLYTDTNPLTLVVMPSNTNANESLDKEVLRMQEAVKSDVASSLLYAVIAFMFVLCGLSSARLYFYVFTMCRFLHTFYFLFVRIQPWRSICNGFSYIILLLMTWKLLYAAFNNNNNNNN